jgi:hypothetical protein
MQRSDGRQQPTRGTAKFGRPSESAGNEIYDACLFEWHKISDLHKM